MTTALYMDDSYLKDFTAKVINANGKHVILDRTAFFPTGGGVECDTGTLFRKKDGKTFIVRTTRKDQGEIVHEVDQDGLSQGDEIYGQLDWIRRYTLMRYHTAAHVLSGVFSREHNLLMTGNQLTTEKGRVDVNTETLDIPLFQKCFDRANELVQQNLPVVVYYKSREEAEKDPSLFKLAIGFPHTITTLRIVDIKGFDAQADGGCHVRCLKEIGKITFLEAASKGKNNRRAYFKVEDA